MPAKAIPADSTRNFITAPPALCRWFGRLPTTAALPHNSLPAPPAPCRWFGRFATTRPLARTATAHHNDPMPDAIYTPDNCKSAYQLNWAVSLFWHEPPEDCQWLAELSEATERDGVRILKHELIRPDVSQFLASTRPDVAPERIVWSIKGRLQHAVRSRNPKAFRRNYGLRSIGSATRETVERYVASQVEHHPMADPQVRAMLDEVQIDDPGVDLSAARQNAHAQFWYNLHICFVAAGRCMDISRQSLLRTREVIMPRSGEARAPPVQGRHSP